MLFSVHYGMTPSHITTLPPQTCDIPLATRVVSMEVVYTHSQALSGGLGNMFSQLNHAAQDVLKKRGN